MRTVQKYADEMRAGRWVLTAETIKWTEDPSLSTAELVDGQHRLHAVVVSGITVPMLVVTGVDAGVFGVIDRGRQRNASQFLQGKNTSHQEATIALLLDLQKYGLDPEASRTIWDWPLEQKLEEAQRHPLLESAVSEAKAIARTSRISATTMALVLLLAMEAGWTTEQLHPWVHGLRTGLGLVSETDPRLVLRNRWARDHRLLGTRSPQWRWLRWVLIGRAWNAWADGRPLSRLVAPATGEKFTLRLDPPVAPEVSPILRA